MRSPELVRACLASSAERFVACDARLRACERATTGNAAAGAIHDARVAARRLRSDLRSLRAFLDGEWTDALRERLRAPADALGAARDADVLLARLTNAVESLPPQDGARAGEVLAPLRAERDAAYVRVRAMLADPGHDELVRDVRAAADEPRLREREALPAAAAAAEIMRAAWKSARKAARAAGDPPADGDLHRIRIKAKRARYAAEALQPVFGRPARRFAKRVAALQDVLGEQHDAVVAAARLRRATWDAQLAFVSGELAARQHADANRCRARWRRCWKRAKRARFWNELAI
ncbi:MAG TPA: CHAD domain-containing protein [Candidatus Baltobacteraceae bacterium]|nr:CHAD domain-containing protein [Candidatus Baltobacteraceae bacterium]